LKEEKGTVKKKKEKEEKECDMRTGRCILLFKAEY